MDTTELASDKLLNETKSRETDTVIETQKLEQSSITPPAASPQQTQNKTMDQMDVILDREMQHNKESIWAKLEKNLKIQKLNQYSESYGRTNHLSQREINDLKAFLITSINNGKLKKSKDVLYNRDTKEVIQVPGLMYDVNRSSFTLKIVDKTHISTLKSLTPTPKYFWMSFNKLYG